MRQLHEPLCVGRGLLGKDVGDDSRQGFGLGLDDQRELQSLHHAIDLNLREIREPVHLGFDGRPVKSLVPREHHLQLVDFGREVFRLHLGHAGLITASVRDFRRYAVREYTRLAVFRFGEFEKRGKLLHLATSEGGERTRNAFEVRIAPLRGSDGLSEGAEALL